LSWSYRWFGPTIAALAAWDRRNLTGQVEKVKARLELAGVGHWTGEEFLAARQVEALPAFVLGAAFGLLAGGPLTALALGVVAYAVTVYATLGGLAGKARRRGDAIRQRLSYVIDLMALMLEAGAGTLRECLEKAATENADHPLGEELKRVLVQID